MTKNQLPPLERIVMIKLSPGGEWWDVVDRSLTLTNVLTWICAPASTPDKLTPFMAPILMTAPLSHVVAVQWHKEEQVESLPSRNDNSRPIDACVEDGGESGVETPGPLPVEPDAGERPEQNLA